MRPLPHPRGAAVLGALLLAACTGEPESDAVTAADVQAIRDVSDRWIEAMLAGDYEAAVALFTQDAVVMPPNRPAIEGREAIRAWYETGPRLQDVAFEHVEIGGHGDLAFVRGTYRAVFAGDDGDVEDEGKFLEVRHRTRDGWLIAVDMYSSNLPVEP